MTSGPHGFLRLFLSKEEASSILGPLRGRGGKGRGVPSGRVEWRKRNPAATLDAARIAVANIISTKA